MLVFIHINKTAGSTVRYILRSSFGPRHCEVEPWHAQWSQVPFSAQDLERLRRFYPRLDSIAGHRVTGAVDLQANGTEMNYFTFMRDPIKTCASRFQFQIQFRKKKKIVFDEWIQNEWTRNNQTRMIAGVDDVDKAISIIRDKQIFVGLTDRFDESMLLLKSLIAGKLNIAYRRVNVASSNTIAQELLSTERTRQLLIEANRSDLALYDFVRHELYPAFQRTYGPKLGEAVARYQQDRDKDFNQRNLALSRLKQHAVYKPLLALYRRGVPVV